MQSGLEPTIPLNPTRNELAGPPSHTHFLPLLLQVFPQSSPKTGWMSPLPPTTWAHFSSPTCCWVRLHTLPLSHLTGVLPTNGPPSFCRHPLADLLKRSAPSRIVSLSSITHKDGKVDFSHFQGENLKYGWDEAYKHSKLHSVICTNELARRLRGTGGWLGGAAAEPASFVL